MQMADSGSGSRRHSRDRESDEDFSGLIRKRLKESKRTGQACDRCKVRKIRCDANETGCGPCQVAQRTCQTTDRTTGKAISRGHVESLEEELHRLRKQVDQQDRLLASHGIKYEAPGPESTHRSQQQPVQSQHDRPTSSNDASSPTGSNGSSWRAASRNDDSSLVRVASTRQYSTIILTMSHPTTPSCHPGVKLLGGTKVSLFGMDIDGSEFDSSFGDTHTAKSYQGVMQLQNMYQNGLPKPVILLPSSKEEAKGLAKLYFVAIHPFAPIVDKRRIEELLDIMYNDTTNKAFGQFTLPEKVMVHMVFGCIKQQMGVRRHDEKTLLGGVAHFKYCMVHFKELLHGQTLGDVQAMCLLALFARNYQTPESAYFILHATLWAAVEQQLHRSVSVLPEMERLSAHEVEMRKRVFWCAFCLTVVVCGRLGRPIPIRIHDIDVELPKAHPDNLDSETGLSKFKQCSFHVSLVGNQLLTLQAQLYSMMYCVRRNPETYETDVAVLEEQWRVWKSGIPPELADPDRATPENKPNATYIRFWGLEFRFLLHHPVSRSRHISTTTWDEANLDECLQICDELLHTTQSLNQDKCLDVQWLNMAFILAVVCTTLFIYDIRKSKLTRRDLDKLRSDMSKWEAIFKDAGQMLGGNEKLHQATSRIMNQSIRDLEKGLLDGTAAMVSTDVMMTDARQAISSAGPSTQAGNSQTNALSQNAPRSAVHNFQPAHDSANLVPVVLTNGNMMTQYPMNQGVSQFGQYNQGTFQPSYPTDYPNSPQPIAMPGPSYTTGPESYYDIQSQGPEMQPHGSGMLQHHQWMRWGQSYIHSPLSGHPGAADPAQSVPHMGQHYIGSTSSLVAMNDSAGPVVNQPVSVSQPQDVSMMWPNNFTMQQGDGTR